jgi:hypothetical protein
LVVGGAIPNLLQGREPKDLDLDVYGLGYGEVAAVYADLALKLVGRAYGVLKVVVDGLELNVNVPVLSSRVGPGPLMDAQLDPRLTPESPQRFRSSS